MGEKRAIFAERSSKSNRAYGKTKTRWRKACTRVGSNGVIVRTSWLYSEFCNNFVKTMINLMSKKSELGIVSDQVGSPTSTHSLSQLLIKALRMIIFMVFCTGVMERVSVGLTLRQRSKSRRLRSDYSKKDSA